MTEVERKSVTDLGVFVASSYFNSSSSSSFFIPPWSFPILASVVVLAFTSFVMATGFSIYYFSAGKKENERLQNYESIKESEPSADSM